MYQLQFNTDPYHGTDFDWIQEFWNCWVMKFYLLGHDRFYCFWCSLCYHYTLNFLWYIEEGDGLFRICFSKLDRSYFKYNERWGTGYWTFCLKISADHQTILKFGMFSSPLSFSPSLILVWGKKETRKRKEEKAKREEWS